MGQEAWRVAGLPLPFANHKYKNWLILYQNATEFPTPFEGGTIALAMGNSVDFYIIQLYRTSPFGKLLKD